MIKLYSESKEYKLYHGSMLDMLEVIEPNSIDAIITDPPYELNFMNKGWDNSGIAFQKETWQKCYEVLKPGGHLLAFGGSRTFHRIACAIEDAGFEIRDTIMWIYGSGMPKSMNIGLAIDKRNGVDNRTGNIRTDGKATLGDIYEWANGRPDTKEYEERKDQNEWEGWGTCLKPAYESVIVAQKPLNIEYHVYLQIIDILNEVVNRCQLNLNVNVAEKISLLNQVKSSVEENSVQMNVNLNVVSKENLLEVMAMLKSMLMESMNLSIDMLCLNFLEEICEQMSKFTIETKLNLITELKILKLLVVQNTLKNTTLQNDKKILGMKQNALTVEQFLKEEKRKLNYIQELSAHENVILKENEKTLRPNLNQIIVARKPVEDSIVDNVIKYGVGGLNIDECRVGTEIVSIHNAPKGTFAGGEYGRGSDTSSYRDSVGRFPANVILTYDENDYEEVCGDMPYTKGNGSEPNYEKSNSENRVYVQGKNKTWHKSGAHFDDEGSAARYFYCAKATKFDRDEGLNEFKTLEISDGCKRSNAETSNKFGSGERFGKNIHPTVKPISLMRYLVRLLSPKGATILDCFNGSGSTGKAVMLENKEFKKDYKYIGIELTDEYLPISKARIEYIINNEFDFENNEKTKISDYKPKNKALLDIFDFGVEDNE